MRLLLTPLLFWGAMAHTKIVVDGRNVFLYKPEQVVMPGTPPDSAVLVLHGSGGFAEDMFSVGFEPLADVKGFFVVYPEMLSPGGNEWGYAKDIPFFEHTVEQLKQTLGIRRFFICGHSAGGSMTLWLQNEVGKALFERAAAVSAGVGKLDKWDFSKTGLPTMLVWNHNDPVLAEYGGEGLFNDTVEKLRRHDHDGLPPRIQELPCGSIVTKAAILDYPAVAGAKKRKAPDSAGQECPELRVLSWNSEPGLHSVPRMPLISFGAAEELCKFFIESDSSLTV